MIFQRYARYYDIFYRNKNYRKECEFLENIFRKYRKRKPKAILDLACGTGGHLIVLAHKGYQLTGVDASPHMLKIAEEKCRRLRVPARLHKSTFQSLHLKKKFDIVICMFSAIDYILKETELKKALKNILTHMKRDSLFVFDFWNEEAVGRHYSPVRKKIFPLKGGTLERFSYTKIFPLRRICEVRYQCTVRRPHRAVDSFKEIHTVRYFSIDEVTRLLKETGFSILGIHPFMHLSHTIRKNAWDVTVVAGRA